MRAATDSSNSLLSHTPTSPRREAWASTQAEVGPLTDLAVIALPTVAADALVHADFVDAGASIVARVALAVVDV